MQSWQESNENNDQTTGKETKGDTSCYDLPFGMMYIKAWKWTRYLPFSPTFQGFNYKNGVYLRLRNRFKHNT